MQLECGGAGESLFEAAPRSVAASRQGRTTIELATERAGLSLLAHGGASASPESFEVNEDASDDLSFLESGSLEDLISGTAALSTRPWISERNVVPNLGHWGDLPCYDLALRRTRDHTRCVLEVKSVLSFRFVNPDDLDWPGYERRLARGNEIMGGDHALEHMLATRFYPGDWAVDMNTLREPTTAYREWATSAEGRQQSRSSLFAWSRAEKASFMAAYETLIRQKWTNCFRIRNANGHRLYRSIRVTVSAECRERWLPGRVTRDHWMVKAINLSGTMAKGRTALDDARARSLINMPTRINYADNRDVLQRSSGRSTCVHEFGHMLGLPDEYFSSSPYYDQRYNSVMGTGADVQMRHYTPFADWIERKLQRALQNERDTQLRNLQFIVTSDHGSTRLASELYPSS